MKTITFIDSHTGGEPTRLVLSGGPDLGDGPLAERVTRWREDFDHYRSAIVCEPRGSDVLVGALLTQAHAPECSFGVIFFNNAGYLGMCGHGMIGVIASLAALGKIQAGQHQIDTPVGVVQVELHADRSVTLRNVPAYRLHHALQVDVPGIGMVSGDVAWGGNWFFLIAEHGQRIALENVEALTDYSWRVRQALKAQGVCGADGAEIDHIELFGAPDLGLSAADSRNFVLCPGKAYDRSPCGTGTSAKLACLAADGKLAAGDWWRQQSITGSVFNASYVALEDGKIRPTIRGSAHINLRGELLLDENDPLCWGLRP
ncbi:4-hydroxyproline epimerase [Massilia sp. W12]|uniref:4-hydroxyproline epimerase n=1 Tax=Massilia sp. W12 TaxID=3126507 RepID=UPI0030CD717D